MSDEQEHSGTNWPDAIMWAVIAICVMAFMTIRGCDGCSCGKYSCIQNCPQDGSKVACIEACGNAYPGGIP